MMVNAWVQQVIPYFHQRQMDNNGLIYEPEEQGVLWRQSHPSHCNYTFVSDRATNPRTPLLGGTKLYQLQWLQAPQSACQLYI